MELPPPPEGEEATDAVSIRVYPSVRAEVEQLALTEGRNRSQQAHWLIREALEARRKKSPAMRGQKVRTSNSGFTTRPVGALDDFEQVIDVKLPDIEDSDADNPDKF